MHSQITLSSSRPSLKQRMAARKATAAAAAKQKADDAAKNAQADKPDASPTETRWLHKGVT